MSEFRLAFPACVIAGKHRLTAEDIVLLRKHTFPEGIRTSDHVVVLLALNNSCPEKCPEWNTFFIEQLAGFIVDYTYPQGSLDEINVAWIMRMFTTDGVVNSALELELILHGRLLYYQSVGYRRRRSHGYGRQHRKTRRFQCHRPHLSLLD